MVTRRNFLSAFPVSLGFPISIDVIEPGKWLIPVLGTGELSDGANWAVTDVTRKKRKTRTVENPVAPAIMRTQVTKLDEQTRYLDSGVVYNFAATVRVPKGTLDSVQFKTLSGWSEHIVFMMEQTEEMAKRYYEEGTVSFRVEFESSIGSVLMDFTSVSQTTGEANV